MTATAEATQIRRGRKFDQVLDGARLVFMRDGFEGASVDEIAREAGVSKATLYSYFPDKRLLFLEVTRSECKRQSDAAYSSLTTDKSAAEMLTLAANQIATFIMSDVALRMFRIAVAESERFPELGRAFYESGPLVMRAGLADYLRAAVEKGQLVIDDIDIAAQQFVEMCKGDLMSRRLFGIDRKTATKSVDRVVKETVVTFMARYGAKT